MRYSTTIFLTTLACLLMGLTQLYRGPVQAQELTVDEIVVIIHKDNAKNLGDYDTSEIRKIFLKDLKYWDAAETKEIVPWQLKTSTDEYKFFKDKVLDMDDEDIVTHWTNVVAAGGTEPVKKRTSREVFKEVSKDENAIGYVDKTYWDGLTEDDQAKVKKLLRVK